MITNEKPFNKGALELRLQELLSKPKLRRAEARDYLKLKHGVDVALKSLEKYATVGGGPMFYRFGRIPLYDHSHLDDWAASRMGKPMRSTADEAA